MNIRLRAVLMLSASALPGCSTRQPSVEQALEPPPPEISRALPLEPPQTLAGRVCKLGASCLDLDERPFEACLVGTHTKHCVDKALEPVEVQGPKADDSAASQPVAVGKR
jgi:hypothetical protein